MREYGLLCLPLAGCPYHVVSFLCCVFLKLLLEAVSIFKCKVFREFELFKNNDVIYFLSTLMLSIDILSSNQVHVALIHDIVYRVSGKA
jgi:hypothetical protein